MKALGKADRLKLMPSMLHVPFGQNLGVNIGPIIDVNLSNQDRWGLELPSLYQILRLVLIELPEKFYVVTPTTS